MNGLYGLFLWINDEPITGTVMRLDQIIEPRIECSEYKVGQRVTIVCRKFGVNEALIGKIADISEKQSLVNIMKDDQFISLLSDLGISYTHATKENIDYDYVAEGIMIENEAPETHTKDDLQPDLDDHQIIEYQITKNCETDTCINQSLQRDTAHVTNQDTCTQGQSTVPTPTQSKLISPVLGQPPQASVLHTPSQTPQASGLHTPSQPPQASVLHPLPSQPPQASVLQPLPSQTPQASGLHTPSQTPHASVVHPLPSQTPQASGLHTPSQTPQASVLHPLPSQTLQASVLHPLQSQPPQASVLHPLPHQPPQASVLHPLPSQTSQASVLHPLPSQPSHASGLHPPSQTQANVLHPLPSQTLQASVLHPLQSQTLQASVLHPLQSQTPQSACIGTKHQHSAHQPLGTSHVNNPYTNMAWQSQASHSYVPMSPSCEQHNRSLFAPIHGTACEKQALETQKLKDQVSNMAASLCSAWTEISTLKNELTSVKQQMELQCQNQVRIGTQIHQVPSYSPIPQSPRVRRDNGQASNEMKPDITIVMNELEVLKRQVAAIPSTNNLSQPLTPIISALGFPRTTPTANITEQPTSTTRAAQTDNISTPLISTREPPTPKWSTVNMSVPPTPISPEAEMVHDADIKHSDTPPLELSMDTSSYDSAPEDQQEEPEELYNEAGERLYKGYTKDQMMTKLQRVKKYSTGAAHVFRLLFTPEETRGRSLIGRGSQRPALKDQATVEAIIECVQKTWPEVPRYKVVSVLSTLVKPSNNTGNVEHCRKIRK